jgi:catechol 2,3-dioxygenase-like lactoylglutathione lyase family enzyme
LVTTTSREDPMSKVQSKLNLTQVGRVCVTVADTDRAIDFYVDALGFEKTVDVPMGDAGRWVEVALPGAPTTIALAPPPQEPRQEAARPASASTRPTSTRTTPR